MASDLSTAHSLLRKELNHLRKFKDEELDQLLTKPTSGGTQFSSGSAWVTGLEIAVRELEIWCEPNSPDNDKFGLDVKP
jgi:hypothetical protein